MPSQLLREYSFFLVLCWFISVRPGPDSTFLYSRHWPAFLCISYRILKMIMTYIVSSFNTCLLPDLREVCLLFCQKKFVVVCTLDFQGQRTAAVKLVSLLRPFITHKVMLSEPHLILGSYFDPPLESLKKKKNRFPCCTQIRSCLVCYSSNTEYQGERGLICSSIPSVLTDC